MKSAYGSSDMLKQLDLEVRLQIQSPIPNDRTPSERLLQLEQVLQSKCWLELSYYSFKGQQIRQMTVAPRALVLRKHAWYLLAWSEQHQRILQLRAYRILDCQLSTRICEPDPDFSVASYFSGHWSAHHGPPEAIELRFCRRMAQLAAELEWHPSQKLQPRSDGSLDMFLQVPVNPELISWILGWEGSC